MRPGAFRLPRDARGQALTELVLVAPLTILIILGVIQMALLFNARSVVAYAAYGAARALHVHQGRLEPSRDAAYRICAGLLGPARRPDQRIGRLAEARLYTDVQIQAEGRQPLRRGTPVRVQVLHHFRLGIPIAGPLIAGLGRVVAPGRWLHPSRIPIRASYLVRL